MTPSEARQRATDKANLAHESAREGAWHAGTWDDPELCETYRDDDTWDLNGRGSNLESVHYDRPPRITPIA